MTWPPSPPPISATPSGVTAKSIARRVTRWGGGLPQYNVGHLDRVAAIRRAVGGQPGLAVAGAAYDGVGIPACIATARSAVDQVAAYLKAAPAAAVGAATPGEASPRSGVTKLLTMTETAAGSDDKQRLKARDLNELIRYTMWAVFRVTDRAFAREEAAAELTDVLDQANGKGIVTRGCYDLQGMRADADYMLWWVAPTSDELQEMYVNFRRTKLGYASEPVWSAMALHRPAEFNKGHIPAYLAEEEPKNYICVYPFVRSYEWYLLDPDERKKMMAEHGMMGARVPGRAGQHGQQLRAERLRVDARLRGRRAAPDR